MSAHTEASVPNTERAAVDAPMGKAPAAWVAGAAPGQQGTTAPARPGLCVCDRFWFKFPDPACAERATQEDLLCDACRAGCVLVQWRVGDGGQLLSSEHREDLCHAYGGSRPSYGGRRAS